MDPSVDLVDDGPDLADRQAGRVGEFPIEITLAGEHWASVAAAHGDDHVGGQGDLGGERLGELLGRVETAFDEDLVRPPG